MGVILDEVSTVAFAPEWVQIPLAPSTWREHLASLDLVFVESSRDGNEGAWSGHLAGPETPSRDVVELLAEARRRKVPTAFWNNADPGAFDVFLGTARLFDFVYTVDPDRVVAYADALGHDRVGVLGFAVQPAIHNPVRVGGVRPDPAVAFAARIDPGERSAPLRVLFDGAVAAVGRTPARLEILSRRGRVTDDVAAPTTSDAPVGAVDYRRLLTAYRQYTVILEDGAVDRAPRACSRQLLEILACGAPVVTTPSAAVTQAFAPREVLTAADLPEATAMVRAVVGSAQMRERSLHLAQRRVWREHTYAARCQKVLHDAGLVDSPRLPRAQVTALVATVRPQQIDHVLTVLAAQVGVDVQVALLTHGFEVSHAELRARAAAVGLTDLVLLHEPRSTPLGACLDRLVTAADGQVVAKIDDDDLYGAHYLSDQVAALEYSGADIVGKQAYYAYLEQQDAMVLRFGDREHRFTTIVSGPTIVARRELARDVRFPPLRTGEDTEFLRRALDAGGRVYSADRFGFIQVRHEFAHTWTATETELLATGEVQFYGRGDAHVLI